MKNAHIFHGTDCTPDDYWYTWLGWKLKERWYAVEIPYYPELNHEPIEISLWKVFERHIFDKDTVLIGHSAGVPLILAILENIDIPITQIILVAGFFEPFPWIHDPILQSII